MWGGGDDIRGAGQTTRVFSCVEEIKGGGDCSESGRLVEGNTPGCVPMACQRSLD